MIHIAICDTDLEGSHLIERIVNNWSVKSQILVQNIFFLSGKELLNYCIEEENPVDIILLQIQQVSSDAIETISLIRRWNKKAMIIIITNSKALVYEAYELGVFRYIIKNDLKIKLAPALSMAVEKLKNSHRYFVYSVKGKLWKLFYKEIVYFESKKRLILIHTESEGVKRFYDKINNIEPILDANEFIRCHQSYIVNIRYIKGFMDHDIVLKGNQKVPISARRKNGLEKKFLLINNN